MRKALLGKSTIAIFGALVLLLLAAPYAVDVLLGRTGGFSAGLPFEFYSFSSAPPPHYGATFHWDLLVADIAIYYGAAVLLAYVGRRVAATRGQR